MRVVTKTTVGVLLVVANGLIGISMTYAATGRDGAISSSAPALSQRTGTPCEELVKECFAYTGAAFANCLRVSSTHSFCSHSQLGALLAQRWQVAPSNPDLDTAPALLGPRLLDRDCIQKFDSQLSAHLGTDTLTTEVLEMLSRMLSTCQKEPAIDLLRP